MSPSDANYLPPQLRKKYEMSRLLGKGGCGEVRLAFQKVYFLNTIFAKKKKSLKCKGCCARWTNF